MNWKTGKGIFTSPQGKRSGRLGQESWFVPQKRNKALLAGCKGPRTCGMPYLSIICQIYQSSFLEAFRNLKVVTKAYSSGRPCGNTSLAWGGEKRAMYQAQQWRAELLKLSACPSSASQKHHIVPSNLLYLSACREMKVSLCPPGVSVLEEPFFIAMVKLSK